MPAVVDLEICAGCGDCDDACPTESIAIMDGKAVVDLGLCGECSACEAACPTDAITIE